MTGTNHLLIGAMVGSMIDRPILAVSTALGSHIIADILPHFGRSSNEFAKKVLISDAVISFCILSWLFAMGTSGHALMLICGVIALAPDALWIPYTIATHRGEPYGLNKLEHALHVIQWGERPWGLIIEIPLAIVLGLALISLL